MRGWSEPLLVAQTILFEVSRHGSYVHKPLINTVLFSDVIGANTDPAEDGFFDITTELETMEITAPSPPTEECLFKGNLMTFSSRTNLHN